MYKIFARRHYSFLLLILGLFCSVHAQISLASMAVNARKKVTSCPQGADYLFPSISAVPFVEVVVGDSDEFEMSKTDSGIKLVHVGAATYVRFPSIVAVGRTIELVLNSPGTQYCVDSAVGTFGGKVSFESSAPEGVEIVSAVGEIEN